MRTTERLRALKAWVTETVCTGREMKAPGENNDIRDIRRQEPRCFLAWQPTRPDRTGFKDPDPLSVCPSILIMPNAGHFKYVEEKRFDRYKGIHRAQELGDTLSVSILFSVYEPGIRLPGFKDADNRIDMSKIMEGTEQGLFTLLDWMDDLQQALLATKFIPNSDLFLSEETGVRSLYTDQSFVVDKRPIYYGFINCDFKCYADDGGKSDINDLLM